MAIREVDAISDAIIATEKEIAGEAWGNEDTDAADASGDRSLEDIGEGLEGQHEAASDAEADADGDAEGDEGEGEGEGEAEGQTEAEIAAAAAAQAGKTEPPEGGRVPSGKLREANEARRAAEAERDALKAEIEKSKGDTTSLRDQLGLVMREIADLKRGGQQPPKPADPPAPKRAPDIFEEGSEKFADHVTGLVDSGLSRIEQLLETNRVETSMAIAHGVHKDGFEKAFEAINKLDPRNPDDRVTVQRIYKSPNPGEALVNWHRRNETFARVGDDPAKFEADIRKAEREALMKDPEFRKALVAEMRGEAARPGPDGSPRTETRLPGSLRRAAGSNLGTERHDHREADDSDQAVADAAWR